MWQESGKGGDGATSFHACSDAAASAGAWRLPVLKGALDFQLALGEVVDATAPPVNYLNQTKEHDRIDEPFTRTEKLRYCIPMSMNDATPGRSLAPLLYHLVRGENRHGVPYLPDDSPLFSIPPHIKCFRENVKSRAHLLKLSYREFKAGAHLCYNDAIFTAVGSAIEMSSRLDRELRV